MKLLLVSVQNAVSKGGIAVQAGCFLHSYELRSLVCRLVDTKTVGEYALQKN